MDYGPSYAKGMSNLELFELFKTPLVKTTLQENLNELLLFSEKVFKEQQNSIKSNVGGFHSDNLDINSNSFLYLLVKNITKNVNIFSKECLNFNKELSITNIWLNINNYKDHNSLHSHPFSKISGVFYLKAPKDCGDIVFINSSEIENFFDTPFDKYNFYNSMHASFLAEPNVLYLFPSWVKHYVKPNLSNEKRISFSFNFN
jgi:uncharacterized protein (TIGR02466 family)